MSRNIARSAMEQMNGRPALIAAPYASAPKVGEVTSSGFMADLMELSAATPQIEEERAVAHRREIAAAYGVGYNPATDKPFIFSDGIAIIPIHGMLINRFSYSWGFVTGYNFIRFQVEAAANDPEVLGIIYDVNSRGGMVAGCAETSNIMRENSARSGGKPSLAVVDSNCFSAGYMLACAADKIAVTPTGGAGSIGVLLMHMDVSAAFAEMGVKVTFIFAGDHKVDGNAYEPLTDVVKADLQAEIDKLYEDFVALVAANRSGKMTAQQVRDTQARCYLAQDALDVGLIDSVATPPDAMKRFFNPDDSELDEDQPEQSLDENANTGENATTTQESSMTEAEIKAANDKAAADARKAERERVAAITGHAEAEGRTKLANHLAMNTDNTVEQAAGILAASAKEVAPVAATKEVVTQSTNPNEPNYFKAAMDTSKQPNVGANGEGGEGGEGTPSRGQQILAAQAKLTGGPAKK